VSGSDTVKASRLVVAAAVLDDLKHPTALLCAARSYPPEHAGQFELPGGKVEPAERPEQALARELDEEIRLSARLGPELIAPRTEGPATGAGVLDGVDSTDGSPTDEAPAEVRVIGSDGALVASTSERTVVLLGVPGVVVVDTPDALLVTTPEHAQDVKGVVDALKESGREDLL